MSKRGARYLSIATVACALTLASGLPAGGRARRPAVAARSAANIPTERVVIAVEGMYCDSCATGIRAMLKRTSGVVSADVSYQRKEAIVDYDPDKITPDKIVETINNLGYKAKVKS